VLFRSDHDNGGNCDECICECFEQEEQEQPSVTPERQAEMAKACAYAEVDEPAGEIIDPSFTVTEEPADRFGKIVEICGCGHQDTAHASLNNGKCLYCDCQAMAEPPVTEPTKEEFKAKVLEYLATYPSRARNLDKIRARGFGVVLRIFGIEKSLLVLPSATSAWQLRRFQTKSALSNFEKDLISSGYIYLPDPNYQDQATKSGFYLLRSRPDGIFSKGLRGVGWCKESDARGEAGEAELIQLAAAGGLKALED
jgi:hypothetical protein